MRVIILAAGRGEQLGKLTEDTPKCMLAFGTESLLQRQIRILVEAGIRETDIYIVAGYRAERLAEIKKIYDITFIVNEKFSVTDNAYSLWLALNGNSDDVLVIDGDLVYDAEVFRPILDIEENVVLVRREACRDGSTGVTIGEKNRLLEIGKHINGGNSYVSIMKLTSEAAADLVECLTMHFASWYTVALNKILDKHIFKVCYTSSNIADINTYTDYLNAKRTFGIDRHIIWVTGASGFLGQKLYHILKRNYNVVGTKGSSDIEEFQSLDLLDREAIISFVKLMAPTVIVHTAGIPEPEKCEDDRRKAYQINVIAVKNLAEVCMDMGIKLIHISTDYVFDGESKEEYGHMAERRPMNYYGMTKLYAEDETRKCADSLIVRIPLLYGYNNKKDKSTFPIKVLKMLKKGEEVFLDNKQIRYPVLIDDVAFGVADSLERRGIIHITSEEPVTKYTWAKMIAAEFGYDQGLIKEDLNSSLQDRPPHVKLHVGEQDYLTTGVKRGTEILRKQMACVFQMIYKSNPTEKIYGVRVGNYRYNLGKKLAQVLPKEIIQKADYVVPVPTSGLYYAMGLAEEVKVPYMQALVKPDELIRSFQISDIALREKVIRNKIIPIREFLRGKSVILVDEAIFTGITLRIVCDMIKACEAACIYIAIPTPICRSICKQYVQPERKLLSQNVNEEELAKYFKVDGVFFQKYFEFESSINTMGNICRDCFATEANML